MNCGSGTSIYINPGYPGRSPFLTVSIMNEDAQSQVCVFIHDVTPDQLRQLADDLQRAIQEKEVAA